MFASHHSRDVRELYEQGTNSGNMAISTTWHKHLGRASFYICYICYISAYHNAVVVVDYWLLISVKSSIAYLAKATVRDLR